MAFKNVIRKCQTRPQVIPESGLRHRKAASSCRLTTSPTKQTTGGWTTTAECEI